MSKIKVVAVVVTYNRKLLFQECIRSILSQSFECDGIIVVDNNSTDGTDEVIKNFIIEEPRISCVSLKKNTGGAGGFYAGIKEAIKADYDFVWIMDDDTVPTKDCLKNLIDATELLNNDFSYLASKVIGLKNEPMNVPQLRLERGENGYSNIISYLGDGLMEIGEATFVSLLINTSAIIQVGLPWPDFFLWGDDSEYTYRLTHYFKKAYVVGRSIAIHKRETGAGLSIIKEKNPGRIALYYYFYRNSLIRISAYGGIKNLIKRIVRTFVDAWKCLLIEDCEYRLKKFHIVNKSLFDFIFNKYNKKSFENRFRIG